MKFDHLTNEERNLLEMATKDDVTGLWNRASTMDMIAKYLTGTGRCGRHALVMLDLDNLKKLNDTMGHQVGDDALKKIGECLQKTFRKSDICGRVGGDEFFAFLKNITATGVLEKVRSILNDMQLVYGNGGEQIAVSVSIGVAMYNGDTNPDKTLKELYAEADTALYKSKTSGKNAYTFADDSDIHAVPSSEAFSKNDLISYSLRGLLDNLASGIAIYHGTIDEGLKPVFCNERLLELLGISYEQFFSHMSLDNYHGIHPDDFERTRQRFENAVKNGSTSRGTLRLRKSNGEYCCMLAITNIRFFEDGSFDWYVIYSEVEEAEQLRYIQENLRRQLQRKRSQATESDEAYVMLNISRNTCEERYFTKMPAEVMGAVPSADALFADIAGGIALEQYRQEFCCRFSVDSFRRDTIEGVSSKEMQIPFVREGRSAQWYRLCSELSINPDTGDIEVFITFKDIDNEVRFGYVIDRILDSEYEFLGQIDTQNGYITKIGSTDDGYFGIGRHDGGDYREIVDEAIESMLPPEYWDDGKKAFSLDKIIEELSTRESYIITFPTISDRTRGERICRWRFEYVDDLKSTILLVRVNASKMLDYGYDLFTGMLGRDGFCKKAKAELEENPDRDYWLMEIDFDNFKLINEKQGHAEGNRFLRRFGADARRRIKLYGSGCIVAHFEGDHFVFLLPMDVSKTPEAVFDDITMLIEAYPEAFRVKLRMGVYRIVDRSLDTELMCDCAHLALKSCKGRFDRFISYYTNDLKDRMLDEQLLASEMQNALDMGQFEVWFQPQVNHTKHGVMVGAEALVRWQHPTRGMISPSVFIPMFEQNGFVYELDKYVWRHTCRLIRQWLDEGVPLLPISFNVSRLDILCADFIETITSIVKEYDIPYSMLHLEVTESAFSENTGRVIEVVRELIERGFSVAVDDFGSGYSSLSLLRSVPAHILKLDMRFFQNDKEDLRNECIVESVIRMAKMLGMAVFAEGVEKVEQADFLRSVGCDYIQGFLYSEPLSCAGFVKYSWKNEKERHSSLSVKAGEPVRTDKNQSYELFRSIISGSNDIIVVADLKTKRLLYANHAAERYYGKGFDPMNVMTCSEYCGEEEQCKNCPAEGCWLGNKSEEMYIDKMGRHMKAVYTYIDWNEHDAFVFYLTDISAEMRELELVDSLVHNIPAAMITYAVDADGKPEIRYVSDQAMKLFIAAGIDDRQPVYEDSYSIIHPDDRGRIREAAQRSFCDKSSIHEELRVLGKDGAISWIDLMMNPVAEKNGTYTYYGIITDITDRKNAQMRADALIQSIPAAITIYEITDKSMARVFISDKAKKILNAPEDSHEKVDMDVVYGRIHPDDEQRVRDLTLDCIRNVKGFSVQFRLKGEQGKETRWVQLDSSPIIRYMKGSVYYYSSYTDITAQKQLELGGFEGGTLLDPQEIVNFGLQESLRHSTPELSIEYIIGFVGRVLHGERSYVIEKNADRTDSNTFEWVGDGIKPERANRQNISEDILLPWYDRFKDGSSVVVTDLEDIKLTYPKLYEALKAQSIHSLVAAPFFSESGEPVGFFGVDNPPSELLRNNSTLVQTIAYFIEAALKRRNLLDAEE